MHFYKDLHIETAKNLQVLRWLVLSLIIMTLEDKAVFSRHDLSISPGPQTSSHTLTQMLFSKLTGEAAATEEGMFLYQHSALSPHPGPPHSCFHVNPVPKWKVISQHWNVNAFIKSDAESEGNLTAPRKGFSVLSPVLFSS